MPILLSDRMLGPVRRWALHELKVHPGQVVVVVGCPMPWIVPVLRGLVAESGVVLVFEADLRRAGRAAADIDSRGWSNVAVLAERPRPTELPRRADRVLLDDDRVLATVEDVERLVAPLGPGGRIAAVCRRGGRPCAHLREALPGLRRESFYGGAAQAVWGQIH